MERLMRWRETQTQALSDGDALRAAAQSGDRAAMEQLPAPHERSLYALCLGMLSHVGDAEDAVQETFLRALGALPRFRGDSSVRTWLTRIAVRVCLDSRRAARPPVPIPADTALASPETSILRRLEILDALSALPLRPRLIGCRPKSARTVPARGPRRTALDRSAPESLSSCMSDTMPEHYDPSQFPPIFVTVDVALFTLQARQLHILLIERQEPPFASQWALPGGFVRQGESLDEAARRELAEETGVADVFIEQLRAFGQPGRDPRARIVSVAYAALVSSDKLTLKADTDAADARWFPLSALPRPLAFDHQTILDFALDSLRARLEHSPLARSLLPAQFTLSQMQTVYEILLDKTLDKRNFRKEILGANLVRPTGAAFRGPHRPASLYEFSSP